MLLERCLPASPAAVLDVGGGPGAYAVWLQKLGYEVRPVETEPSLLGASPHLLAVGVKR